MTYCVGLKVRTGLVMLSDTRTNAGVDHILCFPKMFTWQVPGERAVCVMCAGNLSITQGIIASVEDAIRRAKGGEDVETILNAATLYRVAELFGEHMRDRQRAHRGALEEINAAADATLLVAGQRRGGSHRLFMIYSAGNFIEATDDTPFFQIGEHKYGKPILARIITPETPLAVAVKAALVSMDSTIRSNISVGMPLDLATLPVNEFQFALRRRLMSDDEDFRRISRSWSEALRFAFNRVSGLSEESVSVDKQGN